jgi:hypothetical protein
MYLAYKYLELVKVFFIFKERFAIENGIAACVRWIIAHEPRIEHKNNINLDSAHKTKAETYFYPLLKITIINGMLLRQLLNF